MVEGKTAGETRARRVCGLPPWCGFHSGTSRGGRGTSASFFGISLADWRGLHTTTRPISLRRSTGYALHRTHARGDPTRAAFQPAGASRMAGCRDTPKPQAISSKLSSKPRKPLNAPI